MPNYTLYWARSTGAFAPQVIFELAGEPYERVVVDTARDEQHSPAYLAVNPLGQVPALRLPEGAIVTESLAMVLHLCEAFPSAKLLPPPGSAARARAYRWLAFLAVNVYGADLREYYPARYTADPAGAEGVRDAARASLVELWGILEEALDPGPYLLGAERSAADLYLLMLSDWSDVTPGLPRVQRLRAELFQDPIVKRVWEEHTGG